MQSRRDQGTPEAHSQRGRGTPAVRLRYARDAVRFGRGAVGVRSWCGRDALPVRSPVRFWFGAVLKFLIGQYCTYVRCVTGQNVLADR